MVTSQPNAVREADAALVAMLGSLNRLVVPLVKSGLGSPFINSPGVTVLEVPGRVSGKIRTTPLVCWQFGYYLIVGTARSNSQWIRNLASAGEAHAWILGRRVGAEIISVSDNVAVLKIK